MTRNRYAYLELLSVCVLVFTNRLQEAIDLFLGNFLVEKWNLVRTYFAQKCS